VRADLETVAVLVGAGLEVLGPRVPVLRPRRDRILVLVVAVVLQDLGRQELLRLLPVRAVEDSPGFKLSAGAPLSCARALIVTRSVRRTATATLAGADMILLALIALRSVGGFDCTRARIRNTTRSSRYLRHFRDAFDGARALRSI
jgi:hypothetical protein